MVTALSSCAQTTFSPPSPIPITQFLQVEVYQLQMDYYRDVAAADTKYSGKRYYFGLVRAEQISSIFDVRESENYVLSGNVKFKPVASADIRGIIQGTVFEVSGVIQGLLSGYIVVTDCQYNIRDGGATFPTGGAY